MSAADLTQFSPRLEINPPAPQIGNIKKTIFSLTQPGIEERREGKEQCNRRVVLSMAGGLSQMMVFQADTPCRHVEHPTYHGFQAFPPRISR